ncbi:hypothetical protein X801_04612 [Opisthorchis viverrini]|uniref:Serpin domain-containing protein n=1 Tax=Opisthorchis viverrini TaxID=6198 RepID=A0A1S8WYL6_OPIVI|nr:hypothetical protein X801_04612 [Opisthorchis viverrini]
MYRKSPFYLAYLAELDCMAIKLPFRRSEAGLPKLLSKLRAPGQLASALRSPFHMEEAHLFLPKFKLADQPMINLKPILCECGMKKLFDGGDLPRLSQSCLSVTDAYHKALDEEGVTAAAATLFTVNFSTRLPATISVDHPFFFALVCDSAVPVFVGHVVAPKWD